jgi:DNA polymerase I-like protein with 3'-5' exonuclease and polymerase domains
MWTGRRRHFDDPAQQNYRAFNAIIQGGAADIVMRSMLRLGEVVDGDNCRMLLQIHDAVVFEIKNGMEEGYLPQIKAVMEDVKPDFGVKFFVSIDKWGEK